MKCQKKTKLQIKSSKFSSMKKWISGLYLSIILCFIFVSLIGKVSLLQSYGNIHLRTVVSGSMEPTIPVGSLVVTKEIEEKQVDIGDIITFQSNDMIVTHRIISVQEGKIYTKGDANSEPDQGYIEKNIEKVYVKIPKIGYFFLVVQTSRGTVALISTVITLILLEQFVRLLFTKDDSYKQMTKRRKKYARKMVT